MIVLSWQNKSINAYLKNQKILNKEASANCGGGSAPETEAEKSGTSQKK
jgi:hypothetical protein